MKLLGIVQWITRDKGGIPIAGVRPLVELQKAEWREIDAAEEFPTQGQVFWPGAHTAIEGSLVIFRAEPNPGHKDEYKVVDARPAHEVLDLRSHGTATDIRALLTSGLWLPGSIGTGTIRMLVWCRPDVLIGPIELTRSLSGTVTLNAANLHRLAAFDNPHVRSVMIDRQERLLRVEESAPSGYVDWDDDAVLLRRALEASVRIAKQSGHDTGQTKKQIEEAARAIASQGVGPDAQLDRYRLERALDLIGDTQVVANLAGDFVEALRDHPAIQAMLDDLSERVRADVEQTARANLEAALAREQAALDLVAEAHADTRAKHEAIQQELHEAQTGLAKLHYSAETAASEAEAAVEARVLAAIDRPMELLAEVSVLRPLLSGPRMLTTAVVRDSPQTVNWSRLPSDDVKDRVALRRILTSAARLRGVDPALMSQVHAAVAAGLMPLTLGPGSLATLVAYAHGVAGGRVLVLQVAPSFIQSRDLDEVPGGGLVIAATAAKEIDGVCLVVLEGANRSPIEASILPLLQLADVGLAPIASVQGLRLTGTLARGATTVPVPPLVWSHAVALYSEPGTPSGLTSAGLGDLSLSSDLWSLGDAPADVIEGLIDMWPECQELRPVMVRFGSALARLYDEEERIADALLQALVLPYIATAFTSDEQAEALSKTADANGAIAAALRRLKRTLC